MFTFLPTQLQLDEEGWLRFHNSIAHGTCHKFEPNGFGDFWGFKCWLPQNMNNLPLGLMPANFFKAKYNGGTSDEQIYHKPGSITRQAFNSDLV